MESDPQVSGWMPDFRPAEEQFNRQSGPLRALVGRRILEAWTVWIVDEDWFADLPVVIAFDDGSQVELAWQKFDELSLTWGTIDVGTVPRAWADCQLEWRRNADPALAGVVGGVVTDLFVTRSLFELANREDPTDRSASWLTTGLWLATDQGDLHVFNALDENGLAAEPPPRDRTQDWRPLSSDLARPS